MTSNDKDISQLTSAYGMLFQAMTEITDKMSEMDQKISARDNLIREQSQEIFKLKSELENQAKTIKTLQEYFFKIEGIAIKTAFNQELHGTVSEALASIHPLPQSALTKIQQISADQQKSLALVYGPRLDLTNNQQTLALTYQQDLELQVALEFQSSRLAEEVSVSSDGKQNNEDLSNEQRALEIEKMIAMNSGDLRINQESVVPQESIQSKKSAEPVSPKASVTLHPQKTKQGKKKNNRQKKIV